MTTVMHMLVSLSPMATSSDGKTLTRSEAKNAVALLRRYTEEHHKGNRTRAAVALGVSQATVSNLLNGASEPGLKIVRAMARVMRVSQADILNGGSDLAVSGRMPLAGVTGWDEAEAEARARHPRVEPWVWERVRQIGWSVDVQMSADLVADLAYTLLKHAPVGAGAGAATSRLPPQAPERAVVAPRLVAPKRSSS